jgi:hypothetical protein
MASQTKRRGWVHFDEQEGVNCRERLSRRTLVLRRMPDYAAAA